MDALSPEEQAKFQAYIDDLNRKYQMYYPVAFWVEVSPVDTSTCVGANWTSRRQSFMVTFPGRFRH
jgi:hypothetical protein